MLAAMDRVFIALTSAAVIVAAAGCGTPGKPTAGAPSACSELGGTLGPDQLCPATFDTCSLTVHPIGSDL
jgi:hypothetical protein